MKQEAEAPINCLVYYQKRWVFVPLRYVPEGAIVDSERLKRYGFDSLDPDTPFLSEGRRNCDTAISRILSSVTEVIDPEKITDRKLRQLCIYNDIPVDWVTKRFLKKVRVTADLQAIKRTDRKYIYLSKKNFRQFLSALRSINKKAALIAEILWWLNRHAITIAGDYIPLEAILRLKVNAIATEEEKSTWIELRYQCRGRSHLLAHWLPKDLGTRIRDQIRSDSWMLFPNRNGAPLLAGDLDKLFARAGVKAQIKGGVTSLSLRPEAKGSRQDSIIIQRLGLPPDINLNDISMAEWTWITTCIPTLIHRRGRKSKYNQRIVLNGILAYLREGCPLRRLSEMFPNRKYPPEDVLESQFRRWRNSGIFWFILAVRMNG